MEVLMREWEDDEGEACEEVLFAGPKPLLDLVAGVLNANPATTDFYRYVCRSVPTLGFEDVLNLKTFLAEQGIKVSP